MDIYSCFKSFFEKYRTRMREFFTGGIELGAPVWIPGEMGEPQVLLLRPSGFAKGGAFWRSY
jgi:hypothetical protein